MASRRRRRGDGRRSVAGLSLGLTAPVLALIVLVSLVPTIYAAQLSLHETSFMKVGGFIGFANYRQIFESGESQADTVRTLVYVAVSLVITVPLGFFLAMLLNMRFPFRAGVRVIVFLPWVVSQTVAAVLWKWLLNPDYGPLQIPGFDPFSRPQQALAALILVNVWISYPLAAMLFLAALQTVPEELFEAAEIDGAGAARRLWHVVLPAIRQTGMIVVIMLTLFYFNMVTLVYTLTAGGPYTATQTLSLQAFRESFNYFHLGVGSAYSIILFAFNLLFGAAYVRVLRGER
jgi:ABC-type sugar transport system permease subunit